MKIRLIDRSVEQRVSDSSFRTIGSRANDALHDDPGECGSLILPGLGDYTP